MKKNLILLTAWLVGFLFVSTLYAAPVGSLVVEKGIVKLRSNFKDRVIRPGPDEIPVNAGDEIQTGPDTRVKVFLSQKKESVELFSNTFFNISGVTDQKSEVYLPIGKIRCRINPTFSRSSKKRRQFRVRTVTAMVSVKGSDFVVQATGLFTNLMTISGIIGFANVDKPDLAVDVLKNRASKIEKGKPPTPPVIVKDEIIEQIGNEKSDENWEGVDFENVPSAEDIKGDQDSTPVIEELIPKEVDSARETVGEVQSTGYSTGVTITIEEE